MTTLTIDADTVREAARGRWRGTIYPSLGINVGNGKHGPCPACGGKDRFRCDDKEGAGSWYCNQCDPHAGDGFALVQKVRSCTFPEALHLVGGVLHVQPNDVPSPRVTRPILKLPRVNRRQIALDFELHAILLQERAEKTSQAASDLDCSLWTGDDFGSAMDAVGRAFDDLRHAETLFAVADSQRMKAFQEGR